VGVCFPTKGDSTILELVKRKKRYPFARIDATPYLVEAVHKYFEEARKRGCAIDEELKRYVAERIKLLVERHGVDLGTLSIHDLYGISEDILDVLRILGLVPAPPPRPAAPDVEKCFPSEGLIEGDLAIEELAVVKRKNPLVQINAASYLIQAIHAYFKEAERHGCIVDERLKRYVAERIQSLLEKHGIDLSTMSTEYHGVNKDVEDVLRMLGLGPMPVPRYGPTYIPRFSKRRRRIMSALAKAVAVIIVLLIALAVASQLADYLARTIEVTSQQTTPPQTSTVPQITPQPSYTSSQALTHTTVSTTTPSTVPQPPTASAQVKWVQHINPTSREDYGYGTCLFGNYLVVAGRAGDSPFLALLDRESGEVVKTWSRGSGWFDNCIAVGDKLYVVGYVKEGDEDYQIYVFDRNLNVLNRVQVTLAGLNDVVYQGGYFYTGGRTWKNITGDVYMVVGYIEKRASDLSLVASREIYDANWWYGITVNVGVNPVTGDVWAVGYYEDGNGVWRPFVAILDGGLNRKGFVQLPGYTGFFGNVCFDSEGNAYVSGNETTIKFDKNGNYIKRYNGGGSIICIKDRLYLFSVANVTIGVPMWQLRYSIIDMGTMERVKRVELPVSSINIFNLTGFYVPGRPSFDGRYVYAAGVLDLGFRTGGETPPPRDTEIVVFAVPVVSTVKVVDSSGRPLAGFIVKGVAGNYSLVNSTGADGVAQLWGLAPDAVYVYDRDGRLVWRGNVDSLDVTVEILVISTAKVNP